MHPLIEVMFVDSKNGISDACSTADMFIFFHPNWDWIGLGWVGMAISEQSTALSFKINNFVSNYLL